MTRTARRSGRASSSEEDAPETPAVTREAGRISRDTGAKPSLKALYATHAARITVGLRKIFGDGPPDPEDVTHMAFQKLMERDDHSDIRNMAGFLWRTARNAMLNEMRSIAVRSRYDFEIEHLYFASARDEVTPERVIDAKEQLLAIDGSLRAMPMRRRRCFLLHKVDGLSVAEVGKVMGLPKSTAHREIVKAGIAIDKKLQRCGEDQS